MKPKYQAIIDDIKSKILSGEYSVGEQIPTESALQEIYKVSRHTVRKAILELSKEGFLRRFRGFQGIRRFTDIRIFFGIVGLFRFV